METRILFCWLGSADLKAAELNGHDGFGPTADGAKKFQFDEVVLLYTIDIKKQKEREDIVNGYVDWLKKQVANPSLRVTLKAADLHSPTDFGGIYRAALAAISEKLNQDSQKIRLTFHLSPGTPAMAAVWVILAKTRFPAELIESSKERGARIASVPFDISADYIPDLLRKPDQTLARLAAGLPDVAPEFDSILHRSEAMRQAVLRAQRIAPHSVPVLLEGESGTGKELFARAIHNASPRKGKPFLAVNCGALPAGLVESELFGHKKGAFTGSTTDRKGYFEEADTGTIFLDEIGELPIEMQVKLLRPLQEGEVQRIGDAQARKIDVRIIAATNRSLIDEVSSGSFREDLFYRLAVAVIKLPPLRERHGDISLLAEKFAEKLGTESSVAPGRKKLSASARNILLRHQWPGNIRELQNTLTRAAAWSAGEELSEDDIREALLPVPATGKGKESILDQRLGVDFSLPEVMKQVATHYLEKALAESHDNKTKAAQILGLPSYQTLTNWLKKYGLE